MFTFKNNVAGKAILLEDGTKKKDNALRALRFASYSNLNQGLIQYIGQ